MPVGKTQVGKSRFPLVAHTVGKFPTVHPLWLRAGDFPTECTSVGKFPTVIETVGNFPLPSMQWEISHCNNVVGNFSPASDSGKFPTAVRIGENSGKIS